MCDPEMPPVPMIPILSKVSSIPRLVPVSRRWAIHGDVLRRPPGDVPGVRAGLLQTRDVPEPALGGQRQGRRRSSETHRRDERVTAREPGDGGAEEAVARTGLVD